VRLTKSRALLRVLVLSAAGAFMLGRAWTRFDAGEALGPDGLTLRRLALFEGLLGVTALALAIFIALSLRPKERRRSLGLRERTRLPPGR
jgi:hypothetical protein